MKTIWPCRSRPPRRELQSSPLPQGARLIAFNRLSLSALLSAGLLGAALTVGAVDWPQYRGGNHDATSPDRIQKTWPPTGPPELWRISCTNGLSSFAVANGRAFTQVRRRLAGNDREVCIALDIQSGRELWATDIDQSVQRSEVGNDDGPGSTPTVHDGRVYVLSSHLVLQCLNATNGASIWRKDLRTLYGGSIIGWQSAASPLFEQGSLFINCNSPTRSLLALRASDGSLAWRDHAESMTHSTPVAATIEGTRQVLFATQAGLVSVNPGDGALLWKLRYPFTYTTSLAASPLVYSNIVAISANYTMGAFAALISRSGSDWSAAPLWTNSNFKAHWMSSVCHNGFLYGLSGSSTTASLKCIDLRTGLQKWSQSGFGRGGTLLVDNTLMVIAERGDLVLAAANSSAYAELARWSVFPFYDPYWSKCWNVPAVCDGRVYVRSTAEAVCLDIAIPPLRLLPPVFENGRLRLRVATTNGAALTADRVAAMQVRYAEDLSTPSTNWTLLPGLSWSNGEAEVSDPTAGGRQRFYSVTEVP